MEPHEPTNAIENGKQILTLKENTDVMSAFPTYRVGKLQQLQSSWQSAKKQF